MALCQVIPLAEAGVFGGGGGGGGGGRSGPEPPYLLCVDIHAYSVLHSHICKKLLNPWMAWSFASSALVSRQVLTCSSISATRRRGLVSLILGVVWPLGPLFHLELPSFQLIHFSINPLLLDLLRMVLVGLTQAHMASSERKCPLSLFLPSTSYVSKTSVVTGSLSDGLHVDSQLQCLHWGLRSLHQYLRADALIIHSIWKWVYGILLSDSCPFLLWPGQRLQECCQIDRRS